MTASVRGLLALALLAGVWLLTAFVVLFWVAFAVAAVWAVGNRHPGSPSVNPTPLMVVAATAVPVALTVRELVRASRPAGARPDSRLLPRAQAPELWGMVEELARQVGTTPPAEIRLVGEANAAVTDDYWLFAVGPARRRLYLGAPLLVGLRPDELRAVLAHELGHYARRHAWFTEPAHRGHDALVMARDRIRAAMVANRLIQMYAGMLLLTIAGSAALTHRLVRPVRQRQELEADRIAARVAGAAALADGLRSVPAVEAAWGRFEQELLEPVRRATGLVPDDPYRAFAGMLRDPAYQSELAASRAAAERLPALGFHPSVRRRLDRLAGAASDGVPPPAPDVAASLQGGVLRRLTPRFGRRQPWREWLVTAAGYRAEVTVAALARVVRPDGGPLTVGDVLGHLEAAPAVRPDGHPDPDQLVEAVTTALGVALVRTGRGRWEPGWLGPARLVAPDVGRAELAGLVGEAVGNPGAVDRLRRRLAVLGIDPAVEVGDGPQPGDPPRLLTIPARLDEATEQDHRAIAMVSMAVLLVLGGAGFLYWLHDEPDPPPYRPLPTYDPYRYDPPGQLGRYPGVPVLPTLPLPTLPVVPTLPVRPLSTVPVLPGGVDGLPEGVQVIPTR